jgi:hypothetical protein
LIPRRDFPVPDGTFLGFPSAFAYGLSWLQQRPQAVAPGYQNSLPKAENTVPAEVSRVADRIAKPEVADGEEAKTGDVQSDLGQAISKMKFRDYGSWSAAGKHVSAEKRLKLNQDIAALLLEPSDELEKSELEMIRQYSGFGGTKAADERGVLYDYFTSPPVARMVWKLANKIAPLRSGARMLEPSCGSGVFFDVAPSGVDVTGVEYDARTATVAGLLQPQARVYRSSFEEFNLHQREKFDAVIGNAPFGQRSAATQYLDEPEEKTLDKYFISRSLDNLKSGGTLALIVAPGVMDNETNKEWRAKMLRKGQFIGALRLPNQSFKHTHTGVSPDVVMFRAYPEDVRARLETMTDGELRQAGFGDDAWVNSTYYDENPGHRLGRIERGNFDAEITVGKPGLRSVPAAGAKDRRRLRARAVDNARPRPGCAGAVRKANRKRGRGSGFQDPARRRHENRRRQDVSPERKPPMGADTDRRRGGRQNRPR